MTNSIFYTWLNIAIYFATCLTAMMLRKNEKLVALLHIILLLTLISCHSLQETFTALIAGIVLSSTEFICIKHFNMWKYNYTNYMIPIWLPFTWAIVTFFIIDLSRFAHTRL